MVMLKKSSVNLLSLSVIFLIFSYIFHFSHVFLVSIGFNFVGYTERWLGINTYGTETFKRAVELSIFSTYFVYIGILMANLNVFKSKRYIQNKEIKVNSEKLYLFLGVIFFSFIHTS